jgi:hypothetical protein
MWEDDPQPLPCFDPVDQIGRGPRRSCSTPQQNGDSWTVSDLVVSRSIDY